MSHLLHVRDLVAGYGQVTVLHGIHFSVGQGEVVVILGANGAGKTTTLRAVSGMLGAKGTIELDGASIVGSAPTSWSAWASPTCRRAAAPSPSSRSTRTSASVPTRRSDGESIADIARWYEVFPRLGERRQPRWPGA